MLMRYLKVILYIFLFMIAWSGIFLAIALLSGLNADIILIMAISGGVILSVSFIPFLNWAIKHCFYYKSDDKPVSYEDLYQELLNINKIDAPIMTQEKGNKMIITWKYIDAKWWEILKKNSLKAIYELQIKFNKNKHYVVLIDISKKVEWGVGPQGVKLSANYNRGVFASAEIGKQFGIKENFTLGKIYDYKFKSSEIKTPVVNMILKKGWDVYFGIW
ncbi:hypothetical protein A2272_05800 [Candidatus Peregrinibacteria bacterium RIFOXYA12_FULL_33_12]|nr:MAG: hypothetical protein A2272_05800 [Candidatus Peregrinibacteria bacterium RIFOXYA12_FULL_33_12]OGJ44486.1 MAG: hypothetical protein A2263_00390 [Candidatus Peregrinibacteria bacterium RIFOXYA2_FULL_33_21]OGJ50236.1 MAG: hypothetical protein A2307_06645 [Candidatus Peregrinibacteria bacterium RIFOXYB2_FULL_33_20]